MSPDDKKKIETLKVGDELPGHTKHSNGTITLHYPFDPDFGYSLEEFRDAMTAKANRALGHGSAANEIEEIGGKPYLNVDLDISASIKFETLVREVLKHDVAEDVVVGAAR